jgi:transcriptional regulator with XRE-family HTH domain
MIADNIRALMAARGYSQTELADRAGLSQALISRILSGERTRLYLTTGIALADVFGLEDVRDLTRPLQPASRRKPNP